MGILNNNFVEKVVEEIEVNLASMFHEKYPRLVVYRSNKHFESQIINDFEARTLSLCFIKRF